MAAIQQVLLMGAAGISSVPLAIGTGSVYSSNNTAQTTRTVSQASRPSDWVHLFVHFRWEGSDTTISCADNLGNGHTFTALTKQFEKNVGAAWFYCANAAASGTAGVIITLGAARTFTRLRLFGVSGTLSNIAQTVATKSSGGTTNTTASISAPAGALMLAGEASYWSDSVNTFSGLGSSDWTQIDANASISSVASLSIGSAQTGTVTFTGTDTSADGRILDVLTLT
jgi:hypothetical protein